MNVYYPLIKKQTKYIGSVIKARREALRLPPGIVAAAAGIPPEEIYWLEEGLGIIDLKQFLIVCRGLGLCLTISKNDESTARELTKMERLSPR